MVLLELPGNDDSGAMSSWLAFHMMGTYPDAGQSYYLVNTPFVPESALRLEGGKTFKIAAGGVLDLDPADRPAEWGHQTAPPSLRFTAAH